MRVFNNKLCFDTSTSEEEIQKKKSKIRKKLVQNLIVQQDNEENKNNRLLLPLTSTSDSCSNTDASSFTDSSKSTVGVPRRYQSGLKWLIVFGCLNLLLGVLSVIWTPFNLFMVERLKMLPGFPPYEWWRLPPDEVLMRVYVFNITNSDEFMAGVDKKLRFEELGPFVFLEKLVHTNITFFENGTLTYVAHRTAIFLPEMSPVSLNETIIIPNLAVLGMASKLFNANFFTKFGYNMLLRRHNSQPIVSSTIDNYMWNLTDPLVNTGKKLVPSMVPTENMGILHMIYNKFVDEVTVYMGPKSGDKFFTMSKFHGSPRFNYWPDEKCDQVAGATEGVTYHQFITRNQSLNYFRKTMCRITPVVYVADVERLGLNVFRFELPNDTFHRPIDPAQKDCHQLPGTPALPNGVSDMSPCYFGFPIASSMPHFLTGEQSLVNNVDGLQPIQEKHASYVIVEPTTGVPMESRARSQSNLVIRPLTGFGDLAKFSNMVLPMFWIEYNQVGLPWYVRYLMYFTVKVLPTLQKWISCVMILSGGSMLLSAIYIFVSWKRKTRPSYLYSSLEHIPSTGSSDC